MNSITKTPTKIRNKVKRLAEITQDLYKGRVFKITCLTTLKSLCEEYDVAIKFVCYLAECTEKRMIQKSPKHLDANKWKQHQELVQEAILQINEYLENENDKKLLRMVLRQLKELQNNYKNQTWGAVRIIESSDTLLIEKVIECILQSGGDHKFWAYHVGREYTEKYDPNYGTGLIPDSAPFMEDIVNFWLRYYKLEKIVIKKPIFA